MRHWTTITAYALTLGLVGAPLSIQAAHHEKGEKAAATSESAEAATDMAEEGTTDEAAGAAEDGAATETAAQETSTDEAAGAAEDGAAAETAAQETGDAPADMPEGSH